MDVSRMATGRAPGYKYIILRQLPLAEYTFPPQQLHSSSFTDVLSPLSEGHRGTGMVLKRVYGEGESRGDRLTLVLLAVCVVWSALLTNKLKHHSTEARFPSKRNRLRWQAANHGCHCFDRASYWLQDASACV